MAFAQTVWLVHAGGQYRMAELSCTRLGPVRIAALTGHMLHLRNWSNASRLASETMKRESASAWGQSSGSAIWSGPCFIAQPSEASPSPEAAEWVAEWVAARVRPAAAAGPAAWTMKM